MADDIFAEGFKTDPYWWDAAPRPEPEDSRIPDETDVAIIGSGYTGLHAALALQRGGREALVIEAEVPGYCASSRNAGNVVPNLWTKFSWLERQLGPERAAAMAGGAVQAHDFVLKFIEEEQIGCGLAANERYIVALTRGHYDKMAKEVALFEKREIETGWQMLSATQLRQETGLDRYHGAVNIRGLRTLHPGLYHLGLLGQVNRAGATVVGRTRVTGIMRETDGRFRISTTAGSIRARDVVVATNGYTNPATPWLRRRIVSMRAFQIATEPLAPELMNRVFPVRRVFVDSKINIVWIRVSPDGTRIIAGARTGMDDGDPRTKATKIHGELVTVLPELKDVKVSHCWEGQMGFTFDRVPHIGVHEGMHYAMGHCGIGIIMGSWLGHKLGRKLLDTPAGATPFDGRPFRTRPLYTGNPWMTPLMIGWFNARDRWDTLTG